MQLPRPRPPLAPIEGRYCRLEPLELRHAGALYESCHAPSLYTWLFEEPPQSPADARAWVEKVCGRPDPFYFAVVDRASGKVGGRQALMRIVPEHGVIEVGSICWGAAIARSRVATEALYLSARHVFDDLGYRRFEWKCNVANAPSMAAARRFGFVYEGVFRQHMWVKGRNRDSAWFAMLDGDWPRLRAEYERWLDPDNFDEGGAQRSRLAAAPGQPGA